MLRAQHIDQLSPATTFVRGIVHRPLHAFARFAKYQFFYNLNRWP
jgi:hypothetical protein